MFFSPPLFVPLRSSAGVSATKSAVGVGEEREVMGRRIVNDVGGYGWRVVTRGKLVSCTLFAICKLWLVYTIRGGTRRGETGARRFEGRRMGKIAVCPRRERERERGGWVGQPWPWSALSSSSSNRSHPAARRRSKTRGFVSSNRCSREARSIRSNKYPRLLRARTKEKRPPPKRPGTGELSPFERTLLSNQRNSFLLPFSAQLYL